MVQLINHLFHLDEMSCAAKISSNRSEQVRTPLLPGTCTQAGVSSLRTLHTVRSAQEKGRTKFFFFSRIIPAAGPGAAGKKRGYQKIKGVKVKLFLP